MGGGSSCSFLSLGCLTDYDDEIVELVLDLPTTFEKEEIAMSTLASVVTVFAFVSIAIHVYIWILETFLWTKPRGRNTFGTTEEFAEASKEMAANQGLYNLMLAWIAATGLLAFWVGGLPQVGIALMFAGLGSMAVAGIYLFATSPDKRKPALIQCVPPILSLVLLFTMVS